MVGEPGFNTLRVLVVEDVFLIAEEISDMLEGAGCDIVGPSARVSDALRLASQAAIDGAILDVNINGEDCYPVADALIERRLPFIFVTGYDDPAALPDPYRGYPRLAKPIDPKKLRFVVRQHFRPTGQK